MTMAIFLSYEFYLKFVGKRATVRTRANCQVALHQVHIRRA